MKQVTSVRGRNLLAHARNRKHFWHNVFVVKITIMVGLVALYVLPVEHREWAGLCVNCLWLWKG